jgi:hypothetical protein
MKKTIRVARSVHPRGIIGRGMQLKCTHSYHENKHKLAVRLNKEIGYLYDNQKLAAGDPKSPIAQEAVETNPTSSKQKRSISSILLGRQPAGRVWNPESPSLADAKDRMTSSRYKTTTTTARLITASRGQLPAARRPRPRRRPKITTVISREDGRTMEHGVIDGGLWENVMN